MFDNFFKKNEPKDWFYEQPNTRVFLLPDKFKDNDIGNQVFSENERRKLNKIFNKRDVEGILFHEGLETTFYCQAIRFGEKFHSKSNDLNNFPEDVREFEFFAKLSSDSSNNEQVGHGDTNYKVNDSRVDSQDEYSEKFKFIDQDTLVFDFGLETIDGMHTFFKALEKLPLTITQIFSTAEDNQKSITISFCVMFGNGVIEKIGTYELVNLPNAPKGVPQITIKITIDENLLILKAINENKKPIQILKK